MIDVYPRYAELLARRGGSVADDRRAAGAPRPASASTICATCRSGTSSPGSIPFYLDGDARVRGLVAKGRGFSEDDKAILREVELELLNKVIPEYRDGGRARPDRDLGVAVLPPDPAAAVRHRHLPAHASRRPASAAAVSAAGRRRRAARARGGLPRAAVRPAAGRPLAVGGIGVRRHGAARRGRRAFDGWRPTS